MAAWLGDWRGMFRPAPNPTPWRAALCLLSCVLTGYVGHRLHVPLAWVLGPMLTTAAFAIAGIKPVAPLVGRRLGQMIIGSSIGLHLTLPVLLHLIGWLPAMAISAVAAVCCGALLSVGLACVGGVSSKTAYFCLIPGGLSEMATIGSTVGAQAEPIALSQALRVAILVCILPQVILHLGIIGHEPVIETAPILAIKPMLLVIAAALVGVFIIGTLRFNNPWSIGALFGVAVLTASGYLDGSIPREIYYLGQFLIGITIGARFRREIVRKLIRLTWVITGFILVMMTALLGYAWVMSSVTGIDFASSALASSPGGFAEMTVTAQTLHLDVALVAAFHIFRAFFVNGLATHTWALFDKIGLSRLGRRLGAQPEDP
jgi:uncharacterized protein